MDQHCWKNKLRGRIESSPQQVFIICQLHNQMIPPHLTPHRPIAHSAGREQKVPPLSKPASHRLPYNQDAVTGRLCSGSH